MKGKFASESKVVKVDRVLPGDLNGYQTLFGGHILAEMDLIASLAAQRHARTECVTASMDSVEFLVPIRITDSVCYEACVVWTGKSSMEIFVKVVAEDLSTGERRIAVTSFVTFVVLKKEGKSIQVPPVIPQSEEEKKLYEIAMQRAGKRAERRTTSKELANFLSTEKN